MTLWCLVLAVLAVLLFTTPPPMRQVASRLEEAPPPTAARPRSRRWVWWAAAFAVLVLVLVYSSSGAPGVAVGTACLIATVTCLRLALQASGARRASRARVDVAHACTTLASQIRVGRVPAEALNGAAADCPVLVDASLAQDLGADVTQVWLDKARAPGHGGLRDLARAWLVSDSTGAPLAHNLEQVGDALTADVALRRLVDGELAAPRATGKIMAALPFCGLGMGYLLGGDPLHFLLSTPYGWGCLVFGVALAAAGVLWIDRLSRRAADGV